MPRLPESTRCIPTGRCKPHEGEAMDMQDIPDTDPQETQEWLDALDGVLNAKARSARTILLEQAGRQGAPQRRLYSVQRQHRLHQHDSAAAGRAHRPATRARAPHPLARALERDGDGGAREQGIFRARRAHRELRVGRHALRRRLQSFLAAPRTTASAAIWSTSRAIRRPGIYARAYLEGRITEEQLEQFPPGSRRQRTVVLSASRG